jgi:hypothetical protein
VLRRVVLTVLGGVCLVGALQGCSLSLAEQRAISEAWEKRDAERAQECRRRGLSFVNGACVGAGGP